jgi:polar amino acid transport system substrate-binding protein
MVLSLISSAYISLLIRAAHEQLDPRQVESARALGISRLRTQRLIVWPQILKHLRFPMIMYYADVVKQSALLSVIGVYGATMEAYRLGSDTFRYLEALVVVAALFFLYISVVEYLARLVGNKRRASPNDRVWWDRP